MPLGWSRKRSMYCPTQDVSRFWLVACTKDRIGQGCYVNYIYCQCQVQRFKGLLGGLRNSKYWGRPKMGLINCRGGRPATHRILTFWSVSGSLARQQHQIWTLRATATCHWRLELRKLDLHDDGSYGTPNVFNGEVPWQHAIMRSNSPLWPSQVRSPAPKLPSVSCSPHYLLSACPVAGSHTMPCMREEGTSLSQKSLPLHLSLFAYLFEKYKEMESAPVQTRHIKKPRPPIVKVKQRGCMREALLQCQAGLISSKRSKFWRKAP